jgi:hypothetical protein
MFFKTRMTFHVPNPPRLELSSKSTDTESYERSASWNSLGKRYLTIQISLGALHSDFSRAGGSYLAPPPIAELPSYVLWIQREKIAHVVQGKEGFALVLEQPELGFDKFAPSVEGGLKQVSLKAVDRFAENSGHETAKRFGLTIPAAFSPKLS